ncbi:MAG: nucleoside diphosphate kinase regulator [Xanthomonadales bacterium]|mgnify:FL=1|nr:nucleoside diphosphate kinase regulator [Xanthomonadales bacterium]
MNQKPAITVSSRDLERLEAVLATLPFDAAARTQLRSELDRADVLAPEQMPANVVTMNSVVRFRTGAGESFQRALVYPRDARADGEHVSVLAPVGAAMLGLTVGDSIEWPGPGGAPIEVRVSELVYQPERAGDLHR